MTIATADQVTIRATTRSHAAGELNVFTKSSVTDFLPTFMDDEGTEPFLPSIIVVVVDMGPIQTDKTEENSVTAWSLKAKNMNALLILFCHQNF